MQLCHNGRLEELDPDGIASQTEGGGATMRGGDTLLKHRLARPAAFRPRPGLNPADLELPNPLPQLRVRGLYLTLSIPR